MTTTPPAAGSTTTPPAADPPSTWVGFAALLADIGIPLVAYYGLRALGASEWTALLVATLAAGARLGWVALRSRRITWFSAIMLAVFGVGLLLSFVSGDERFLLLKESFGTAAVGVVFLLSLLGAKPLTLSATQTWQPGNAANLEYYYETVPQVRRMFRVTSIGWGVGLLLESLVRVPLVYALPVDVMAGLSTALSVVVIGGLAVWNGAWGARLARQGREAQAREAREAREAGEAREREDRGQDAATEGRDAAPGEAPDRAPAGG